MERWICRNCDAEIADGEFETEYSWVTRSAYERRSVCPHCGYDEFDEKFEEAVA